MNIKQERMKLIWYLHKEFLNTIYEKQEKKKLKAMAVIAQKNQAIRNSNAPCFLLNDIWYTHPHTAVMPKYTKGIDRILDVSLKEEAMSIIQKTTSGIDNNLIVNYIGNTLKESKTITDVFTLLCETVWQKYYGFIKANELLFNIGEPLTEKEITLFHNKNKQEEQALKYLFMTELLLAKTE